MLLQELTQLTRFVFMDVKRIDAIRHQDIRRRDERGPIGPKGVGDRPDVHGRVFQMFNHLKTHDQIKALRRQRYARQIRTHIVKTIAPVLGIRCDPIQRHNVTHCIGDFSTPVAVTTAEIESSTILTLLRDFDRP